MKKKWISFGVFCSSLFLLTGCFSNEQKPIRTAEVEKGIEKVQSFNKKSVAEVQKEIKAIQEKREEEKQVLLQQQEQQEQEEQENEEKSYKELFHNSLILGDSLAEGFLDGGFLDPIHVRTDRGKSVYHMEDQLELVRSFAPENIFLIYGMNDVLLYEGDTSLFRERYREFLEQLQQVDPDAKIYINLIFPVQQRILKEKPAFQHIDAFNQVLIDLGKEMNIPVLDNHSFVKEEEYEPDGIHFKVSFYPQWLDKMVKEANLT